MKGECLLLQCLWDTDLKGRLQRERPGTKGAWEACELCSMTVRWKTGRQRSRSTGPAVHTGFSLLISWGLPSRSLALQRNRTEHQAQSRQRQRRDRGPARGVDVTSNSATTSTGHKSHWNPPIPLSISRTWVSFYYPALSLAPDGIFTAIEPKWSVFPHVPRQQGLGTERARGGS